MAKVLVETFEPHQVGWLRRPDRDTSYMDVWEHPDGTLYSAEKGKKPYVLRYTPPKFPWPGDNVLVEWSQPNDPTDWRPSEAGNDG